VSKRYKITTEKGLLGGNEQVSFVQADSINDARDKMGRALHPAEFITKVEDPTGVEESWIND
jgi:hypothetical protein